ncbi:MAG: valine--tRNA ligase [bacterium]|jgi:valyl-tRNA synthetase
METRYDPAKAEEKWYSTWLERGLFTPKPGGGKPFVIVMPPPNITGPLTMGHVLNMTLQDVLVRYNMIQNTDCLWLPGKDHAGIATQVAVEKVLKKENKTRQDLGREKFTARVWEWKELMSDKISEQLRHLGAACDWSRERFTLDEGLARAVRTAFVTLYKQGLIYRGEYVINWCPRCRTSLADEEVEREELKGKLWYIRYPVEGGGHITVATTRPETMLGDTAVAVNPADERYKWAWDKTLVLPVIGRKIPLIRDDFVDPGFGTGAVKVTPAHDADDFAMGGRHGLERVVVMDETGVMNENAGEYKGTDRFECRGLLVERLEKEGLLEKVEDYDLSLGQCYRCGVAVEPYLSTQYFVKMKPLAAPALEAVRDGRIRFHPDRWTKVYYHWMEGIRDWCISRQLWWGHRIPVWYCDGCGNVVCEMEDPTACDKCGGELRQEEDVLDTWFSSWLWPISTLGWPDETDDLRRFYPTTVLVTGPDIIFFWVARMIMAGLYFREEIPFEHVYFHGLIRDERGRKMSKSLGNSPDPSELVDKFGSDALRFTTVSLTPKGSDVLFAERLVETGRNFANKVWNAARLIQAAGGDAAGGAGAAVPDAADLEAADRWILSAAGRMTAEVRQRVENFELNEAAKAVYEFVWHQFCDWYLEIAKERFYSEDATRKGAAIGVARAVLRRSLALLHPFMPFITEEINSGLGLSAESLIDGGADLDSELPPDAAAEAVMKEVFGIIEAVRNIRGEMGVHPSDEVKVYLKFPDRDEMERVLALGSYISKMARVSDIVEGSPTDGERPVATSVVGQTEIAVPLGDVIDIDVERARLKKELARIGKILEKSEAKLGNAEFREKAPDHVIEKEEDKVAKLNEARAKIEKSLSMIAD